MHLSPRHNKYEKYINVHVSVNQSISQREKYVKEKYVLTWSMKDIWKTDVLVILEDILQKYKIRAQNLFVFFFLFSNPILTWISYNSDEIGVQ